MTWKKMGLGLASLAVAGCLVQAPSALAQVAGGSTTVGTSVTTQTQIAMGWSVKKTLLGKSVYNDEGKKVGKVEDLIISPDKSVSYVIVGAGGFVGIGQHDVAVPITQIQDRGGKLVFPGVTKESIKAMPSFEYANDTGKRDQFIAAADKDIANGRAKVAELEKKAGTAAGENKVRIEGHLNTLKADLKVADAKLNDLKHAAAVRWHEFEAEVSEATARLRKSVDAAKD